MQEQPFLVDVQQQQKLSVHVKGTTTAGGGVTAAAHAHPKVSATRQPPYFTHISAAQEAKIPDVAATKIMSCIADPGKDEMLQKDLRNTVALGVQKSCTIKVGRSIAAAPAEVG